MAMVPLAGIQARPFFDKSKDILLAQFDSKPDPDDIHAIAALGSMLVHDEFDGVDYLAVAGAYGIQGGQYLNAPNLFNMAFGPKNVKWVDAHNDWNGSVVRIKNRIKPILANGGKVWVQEAGQSNITADWLRLLAQEGVSPTTIKNNVIVVQHSLWNENATSSSDLAYVRANATYQPINDGNHSHQGRGPDTPNYTSRSTSFTIQAKNSPNLAARALWTEADRVIQSYAPIPHYSFIKDGGVDFSDCVENHWIFNVSNAWTVTAFWNKFVINVPAQQQPSLIGKTIALESVANGKHARTDSTLDSTNWPLVANSSGTIGTWKKFKVIDAGGGQVAFLAQGNGKYVCADWLLGASCPLNANRTAIGPWEKFTIVNNSDNTISLKALVNGKYVTADMNANSTHWPLNATGNSIGAWQKFTVTTHP